MDSGPTDVIALAEVKAAPSYLTAAACRALPLPPKYELLVSYFRAIFAIAAPILRRGLPCKVMPYICCHKYVVFTS